MTKALTVIDEFKLNIGNMEEQFKAVLPKHIKSEKFLNVVVTAVRNNPKLLSPDYNRPSLFNACMDCAQDGLLPNGQEAALVPFKGKIKYMPMVTGITKKARNSGEIATMDAIVVYKGDEYESWVDEKGPHFKYRKARENRGDPILTFAYAILKDGGVFIEEINEEEMKSIEKCCRASDTPWKGAFKDEMRRKSALRRLCKYRLPSSSDMDTVIRRDDDIYDLTGKDDEPKKEEGAAQPSTLEKVVSGDESGDESKGEVVDADFKEEPTPEETAPPEKKEPPKKEAAQPEKSQQAKKWLMEGKVTELTTKSGKTNGKPWTKYGCKLNKNWFGTFSKTFYTQMIEAKEHGSDVEIIFEEAKKDDKVLRNIIEFRVKWDDEAEGKGEPQAVPEDEIPI